MGSGVNSLIEKKWDQDGGFQGGIQGGIRWAPPAPSLSSLWISKCILFCISLIHSQTFRVGESRILEKVHLFTLVLVIFLSMLCKTKISI